MDASHYQPEKLKSKADTTTSSYGFGMKGIRNLVKIGDCDYITRPFNQDLWRTMAVRAIAKKRWAGNLVFASDKMSEVYSRAIKVAELNTNVCIYGESGTGKELIARVVHDHSPRRHRPLVTVACATIPEKLTDSVLFGYVDRTNAFPMAQSTGILERANKGNLFLDEVAELNISSQARLLGAIEGCEFRKLGNSGATKMDVRIIATTNKDLGKMVEEGKFRQDLFYRLNVIPLTIPPLRERKMDIPVLVDFFLEKLNWQHNKKIQGVNARTMDFFMNYDWPGNVRELENCLRRAVLLKEGDQIDIEDLHIEDLLLSKNTRHAPQ